MYYFLKFVIFVVVNKLSLVITTLPSSVIPKTANSTAIEFQSTTFARPQCVITKINTTAFRKMFTPQFEQLLSAMKRSNIEARFVGGAVRDILCNKVPEDMDFASPNTPQELKAAFRRARIYLINPNGEKHGTITPRIDGCNFEITTLRRDVVCDGRHAQVMFTKDWTVDAARRDLTINAMFLDFNGTLYDYFNGKEDLEKKRIIFVGDPFTRIKEDYLRILRYFRFFARFSRDSQNHDPKVIEAISSQKDGLAQIAGERKWLEFKRIFPAKFGKEAVLKILDLGLAPYLGLNVTDSLDLEYFSRICDLSRKYSFKPVSYIAALLPHADYVKQVFHRLRLSGDERDMCEFLVNFKSQDIILDPEQPLRPFQELLIIAKKKEQIKSCILELIKFKNMGSEILDMMSGFNFPDFPIDGLYLRRKGLKFGKEIGFVLMKLKQYWVQFNFNVTLSDLDLQIPGFLKEFQLSSSTGLQFDLSNGSTTKHEFSQQSLSSTEE